MKDVKVATTLVLYLTIGAETMKEILALPNPAPPEAGVTLLVVRAPTRLLPPLFCPIHQGYRR